MFKNGLKWLWVCAIYYFYEYRDALFESVHRRLRSPQGDARPAARPPQLTSTRRV